MTTRPREADKVRKSSDVQLQIRGFDSKEQVKEFAGRYLADPREVKKLVIYLRKEKIWDLAEIPSLLLMMCLVWRDRHHTGLPKSKLELYERFVETLLYQMDVKDSEKYIEHNILERYREDLTRLGKLALDALLQGTLYFPLRQLHTQSSALGKKMIRSGLFQISKFSSADPKENVFFLHKSVQEFLAAWFIMHEAGLKDEKTDCLSSIDSLDKVSKVNEILTFMCQWSEEGAKAVFSLLQLVGEKHGLTSYNFTEAPAIEDMCGSQKNFCITCLDYFMSCSALHRQAVYPLFLNCVHGVVVVDCKQSSRLCRDAPLKTLILPYSLVFEIDPELNQNVISIMHDLNVAVVTGYGDTKAAHKYFDLSLNDFFLKKEGQELILYLTRICKAVSLPVKLLSTLTSAPESPPQALAEHLSQNQHDSSSLHLAEKACDQTQEYSLSFVREIRILEPTSKELTLTSILLLFVNRLQVLQINYFKSSFKGRQYKESYDVHLIESLVSYIPFTDNLVLLELDNIDLTTNCAADIARSLHQAPNLRKVNLSHNMLSSGVGDLAKALHHVTRLSELRLRNVYFGDQECWLLATSLKHVVKLQVLDLSGNSLGHGITELGKHLHHVPNLIQLNLCKTQMGEEEVTAVACALQHVAELLKLDLSYNSLGRGVTELIQHLSSIPRLSVLRLNGVQMTKKEASELVTVVRGRSINLRTAYHKLGGRLLTKDELSWEEVTFDDE